MLTFYDEKGNGYGAQVEFTTKNAVNGERSVSGTILSNDKVLSKIDRGWSFDWDGETYKVIYAKPKDEGRSLSVSLTRSINSFMTSIIPIATKSSTDQIASKSISRRSSVGVGIDIRSRPKRTPSGRIISGTRNVFQCLKTLSSQRGLNSR